MSEANPSSDSVQTGSDALTLLRADHRQLEAMIEQYQQMAQGDASAADRSGLVARIGGRLRIHARIEDEIFYPALPASEDLERARTEHQDLEAEVCRLAACGLEDVDGALSALGEALRRHVEFEERTLFPLAEGLDLQELGTRLLSRRGELSGDYDQPD